jgi:hypothetical protein
MCEMNGGYYKAFQAFTSLLGNTKLGILSETFGNLRYVRRNISSNKQNSCCVIWFISWIDHGRNEVLLRVMEQRNIANGIRKRKANWIGHILRRNCLLRRVIKGEIKWGIEVTGRRGRRRGMLLDYLKERREYLHLKEEVPDRTMWTARFGRGFGPVVRHTTKCMNMIHRCCKSS